jgi:thioredoxin reductase (NADPH)
MHTKVAIIGSGPAGLTAAIYTARANLEPLVIRGLQPGGLITTTSEVENFPGFPESIGGFELTENMQKQAERFGTSILDELIVRADFSKRPFQLLTDSEQTITAETVIIATGASPRKMGIPGEARLANRGVSYCATCDGLFFRGKRVIVVGGGNSALDEALFLTRFVSELTLVHRRDELRADPILQERAFDNPKMRFAWSSVPVEVVGEESVTGLRVRHVQTDEETILETDGVFVYIGHVPNTDVFTDQLAADENGFLLTDNRMRTVIPGVYAAGDAVDHIYRQAITAAGQGCMAGMEAISFLAEQEHLAKKAEKVALP